MKSFSTCCPIIIETDEEKVKDIDDIRSSICFYKVEVDSHGKEEELLYKHLFNCAMVFAKAQHKDDHQKFVETLKYYNDKLKIAFLNE